MCESLRNDGRVWVPKQKGDTRSPEQIPEAERDYYLERKYPSFGNLAPRDIASRAAKEVATRAAASARAASACTSTSPTRSGGSARRRSRERYGNLFEMYERITGEDPYKVPMRIYPAVHYTMGGLWVDYNLMSNDPGAVRARRGELLRSRRQPPRRVGAHAGPGRRLLRLPYTIGDYLAQPKLGAGRRPIIRAFNERRADVERARREAARRSRASAPSTRSTASSARSCGTTAAWRATTRA